VRPPLCRSLAHLYVSVPAWADNPELHGAEGSQIFPKHPLMFSGRGQKRGCLPMAGVELGPGGVLGPGRAGS
jgi:hypothetical protein